MIGYFLAISGLLVLFICWLIINVGFFFTFTAILIGLSAAIGVVVVLWLFARGIFYDRKRSEAEAA